MSFITCTSYTWVEIDRKWWDGITCQVWTSLMDKLLKPIIEKKHSIPFNFICSPQLQMYIALSLNKNMSLVTYIDNRKTKPPSTKTQTCLDGKRVN